YSKTKIQVRILKKVWVKSIGGPTYVSSGTFLLSHVPKTVLTHIPTPVLRSHKETSLERKGGRRKGSEGGREKKESGKEKGEHEKGEGKREREEEKGKKARKRRGKGKKHTDNIFFLAYPTKLASFTHFVYAKYAKNVCTYTQKKHFLTCTN
uniref:Uncharacterized protein n=1 Tax=Strongyloides stercoralis TaxID=6248 RepID=A0AAF5DJV9_STRER